MEKLVESEEKIRISMENQLRMTMFPGILFGFVPSNYEQLNERIICSHCLKICEKLKVISDMKIPVVAGYLPHGREFFRKRINTQAEKILAEIKIIEVKDKVHWGDEDNREISRKFITAYMACGSWVYCY